jgi:hypothetical protein
MDGVSVISSSRSLLATYANPRVGLSDKSSSRTLKLLLSPIRIRLDGN